MPSRSMALDPATLGEIHRLALAEGLADASRRSLLLAFYPARAQILGTPRRATSSSKT